MKGKLNVKPRTIFCHDNLEVLKGMNSECVDLIYLDPPFNKNDIFTAPIGRTAEGASFKDIWGEEEIKDEWVRDIEQDNERLRNFLRSIKVFSTIQNYCYLVYMAIRAMEMHRVLKNTGSFYLHCDHTMSHYLKIMLDCVFGDSNFRNEIIWSYPDSPSAARRDFPRKHDTILRYAKTKEFIFNAEKVSIPYAPSSLERVKYPANKSTVMTGETIKLRKGGKLPTSVWGDIKQAYRYRESLGYPTQKPRILLERILSTISEIVGGGRCIGSFLRLRDYLHRSRAIGHEMDRYRYIAQSV